MIGRTRPRPVLPPQARTQIAALRAQMTAVVDAHLGRAVADGSPADVVDRMLDLRADVARVLREGGGRG